MSEVQSCNLCGDELDEDEKFVCGPCGGCPACGLLKQCLWKEFCNGCACGVCGGELQMKHSDYHEKCRCHARNCMSPIADEGDLYCESCACLKCGAQIEKYSGFCDNCRCQREGCGLPLLPINLGKYCEECQCQNCPEYKLNHEDYFCPACEPERSLSGMQQESMLGFGEQSMQALDQNAT
ncbi:hypothetical protein M231_07162 [Tremella mesenterica]|uniref:Uncharacterized protein n=1 Tax=Tremella mesenterica TaxID=5217 RepID=A0A4Q1BC25_TREME|nr:hypothetical protein M231_07162 [Tremella mesenterica]